MFESQIKVHSAFNRLFSSSEGNWMVPAMIIVCKTTNKMAIAADRLVFSRSKTKQYHRANLEKSVPILQDSYSKTFNDRTEYQPGAPFDDVGSKQAGVLAIVNLLFEMYFRLNILRLCKNLIRPVETKKLSEKGSMAEMVTYRYFIGRLSMFEDQHSSAETHLEYALQHCHKNAKENKKRILKYLIPIKLYRGRLPTTQCKLVRNTIFLLKPINRSSPANVANFLLYNSRIYSAEQIRLGRIQTTCRRNKQRRSPNFSGWFGPFPSPLH